MSVDMRGSTSKFATNEGNTYWKDPVPLLLTCARLIEIISDSMVGVIEDTVVVLDRLDATCIDPKTSLPYCTADTNSPLFSPSGCAILIDVWEFGILIGGYKTIDDDKLKGFTSVDVFVVKEDGIEIMATFASVVSIGITLIAEEGLDASV